MAQEDMHLDKVAKQGREKVSEVSEHQISTDKAIYCTGVNHTPGKHSTSSQSDVLNHQCIV